MANISEDDGSIVFTRPAPGFRVNPTQRQFEPLGPAIIAASRAKISTFLESLPALSLVDLPEDNIECPICTETYQVSQDSDVPVRLPCSHIIGKDCLSKWLNSSVRNANNNGCPTCRAVLFNRYRPVDEPHVHTVQEILASLRFDVLGYLRAQEHERTPAEYNRIRDALNRFRASMDGAASREARGLIRLLNSHDSTVRNQLASLRADVDRYAVTQRHERTFEEFSRINHALTELVPSLDGAAREDFFNLVRDLHRAFQSARPVQIQRGHDVRTEPVNQNAPTVREPQVPGRARERVHRQEMANPMRTAPDGPERFDENDRATVRGVPERVTVRASSGMEELADDSSTNDEYDSSRVARARLRARIEEMSRTETLQERIGTLERHHPRMAAPRHARRVAETRADRPAESEATDQRHASLIAEIGNQQRAAAERLASRRNDELRFTMPGREASRLNNNRARPAGSDTTPPPTARASRPQEQPRAAQQPNPETRFTIPRLQPTTTTAFRPSAPPPHPSETYASINDRIAALDASLTRMENQQRVLARTLERLGRESVARRRGFGVGGGDVDVGIGRLAGER